MEDTCWPPWALCVWLATQHSITTLAVTSHSRWPAAPPHAPQVTQCLGVLAPVGHWYMVVARPSGSVANYPKEEDLMAFKIPHGVFVKMEKVGGCVSKWGGARAWS